MPIFELYDHVLLPLGESLQSDVNFAGIKIFYDHRLEEIERSLMPAISYFPVSSAEDSPLGTMAHSLQKRRARFRVGFLIAVYESEDRARLAQSLFHIYGLLTDWLVRNANFDSTHGIIVAQDAPLRLDYDVTGDESGLVATGLLTTEFDLLTGTIS